MSCVRRAPATFSLDAERRSVAVNPAPDPESVLREAAESCPFFAIQVRTRAEGSSVGESGPTR